MRRVLVLLLLLAALGFALAGCGTSYGPGGGPGGNNAAGNAQTAGQDTNSQPSAGGLKTPVYTAAHNECSLFPISELARQNNVKPTIDAIATKISSGETTPAGRKAAYAGCVAALKQPGAQG